MFLLAPSLRHYEQLYETTTQVLSHSKPVLSLVVSTVKRIESQIK